MKVNTNMGTQTSPSERGAFTPLTVSLAWQLAAPHTWPASIMPVLISCGFAVATVGRLSAAAVLVLLVICILMQASVNTFNDYFDYVKGTDSADDNVEVTDAVLVYNAVNPRSVLALAIGLLAAAFALGIVVILWAGFIPLACYYVLTGCLDFLVLLWSVPMVIGIGLIMMTNNTCDIEKDLEAGRRTLPVLLGRERVRALYHGLMVVWVAAIVLIVWLWFANGLIVMPFMVLAAYPLLAALWKNPLVGPSRVGAMGQIASVNVCLGAFYAAALML